MSMDQKTRNGTLLQADSRQDQLLGILYGSPIGRMLLKPLTAPALSRLAGRFLSTGISRILIKPFIRSCGINMEEYAEEAYGSYNDFFSRNIRPECRPIDRVPEHLISPADSKLTVLPIGQDNRFVLKHTEYTVASLLHNRELAEAYDGGLALIFRLCVDDYHRYCYVADGTKTENIHIPGALHTVNPIANDYFPIYKENSREYCVLHTDRFGEIVIMEVGALMVGKIVNHHGAASVLRGQEKGYFQFGGSTVVLLLKPNTVDIDADIMENSCAGIETIVKYGEKIGTAFPQT